MLEDLLMHALDAIWIVDENGIVRFVNPAAEVLTGYDRSEVVGQPPAKVAATIIDTPKPTRSAR